MTKWELSRRDLLKKLGVGGACLPLLGASRSYAQPAAFPKRLIVHLQTEGYRIPNWLPPAGALTGPLPSSTSPLEEFKNELIFLGNLGNEHFPGCDRWAHGAYGQIFTAGPVDASTGNGKEYWEPTIPSVDQVIANGIAKVAPHLSRKSLAFEIGVGSGGFLGSKRCFWSGPKQPITPEPDPYKAYAQIFAGRPMTGMPDPGVDRLVAERKSILDFVGKDLERFRDRLGADDRMSVAGHLESIRSLEKQLAAPRQMIGACGGVMWSGDPSKPIAINTANTPVLWTLQMEMIVAALKCDVTRVGTTQVGDSTGGRIIFDFVPGVPRQGNGYQPNRDWHDLGHRPVRSGVPDGDDKSKVDKWTMGKFAELLTMLKAVPEGTGTMLDNTVVLWANHMEDGANHGAVKIPWIIAGKGQGYFKTGQSLPSTGRDIGGVMAELCAAMDVPVPFFGDANTGKPMPELRAGG